MTPMADMGTYQTCLRLSPQHHVQLEAYAALLGRMERTLFAKLYAGGLLNQLKCLFLVLFCVTARQFNAAAVIVRGRIDAIRQSRVFGCRGR